MPRHVPSGGGNAIASPAPGLAAVKELWDAWEIHCLILASLSLQVLLFLTAGMRQRSTSGVLRTVLWLAYLSADAVAIFVLGHLTVRASEPRHQLMSFWAPFVLVHLGGQDTITAFSKQDNELWMRHMLSLVTQVAIAGYVVAKASWHDTRLKAAMVLVFLSGCFKYAERTLRLYYSSPATLQRMDMIDLPTWFRGLLKSMKEKSEVGVPLQNRDGRDGATTMGDNLVELSKDGTWRIDIAYYNCVSMDAPPNKKIAILAVDDLCGLLQEFQSNAGRYRAYDYVATEMARCYSLLYTKGKIREVLFYEFYTKFLPLFWNDEPVYNVVIHRTLLTLMFILILLYTLFQCVSIVVALVLFMVAEKGDQLHTSRADIVVSYILLVGAIALDGFSATIFLFSRVKFNLSPRFFHVASYILPSWTRKQWSEELAQYSMIKRHVMQDTTGMASVRQWIGKRLGHWGVGLLESTHIPITKPIKEFILDSLLLHGQRKEWHIASSRGLLAVQNWMDNHRDSASTRTGKALEKIIGSGADFPISVLIWHLATDICYHFRDNTSINSDQMKKDKEVSRELSNYIMYLIFKCGVKLTINFQLVHDKAHREIRDILSHTQHQQQIMLDEKTTIMKIFEAKKIEEQQDQEQEESVNEANNASENHLQKLLQVAQDFDSPLLPRACKMAQELVSINDEADCWGLIAAVWSEMLYYIAPRCGSAFHYEHLCTGGELATHVLRLMNNLGPFLPPPN